MVYNQRKSEDFFMVNFYTERQQKVKSSIFRFYAWLGEKGFWFI